MRVLLVGNYLPDKQESMQRYAEMIRRDLESAGFEVTLVRPSVNFGKLVSRDNGLQKWLGYIDKFILFPGKLRYIASGYADGVVHICDHSNAMYTAVLKAVPHLVTCHDVLAIKSALGAYPQNPVRWSGRWLQRWIRQGLARAQRVICDSNATREELARLEPALTGRMTTVYPALNYRYVSLAEAEAGRQLRVAMPDWHFDRAGYLFHVGANQWYKNREGLLRIYFAYIQHGGFLPLVLAGKPLPAKLRDLIRNAPVGASVVEVGNVDNATLNALYANAAALIFPSLYEGFGWPVLEAFAAGCPVACSRRASLPEVGGHGAIYFEPDRIEEAAEAISAVVNLTSDQLAERQAAGAAQVARFSAAGIRDVIENYHLVLLESAPRRLNTSLV